MNGIGEKLSFGEWYEILSSHKQSGIPDSTPLPERLPIDELAVCAPVFQPRDVETAWLATSSHISTLAEAARNNPLNALEPLTIWWSGKAWFVIDGHHRLAAYKQALEKDKKLKIRSVPVVVFQGTLAEAVRESVLCNSRDKLPMRKGDKLERAWKLVCVDESWTREQISEATGVSVRTVANMRATMKELKGTPDADLLGTSWEEAKRGSYEGERDEKWEQKLAIDWQKRLVRAFDKKFAEQPRIAARALELYSERLPHELIRSWSDELREVLQEEPHLLDEPEF